MYDRMGICKMGLKDYTGAVQDFTKDIELGATYQSYYNRGLAKKDLGDKKGACEDWHKAFEMGYAEAENKIDSYCK